MKRIARASAGFATITMMMGLASTAHAKPLYSVWQLDPTTATGDQNVSFDSVILEQRLLPLKAVKLRDDATTGGGKVVKAGTSLFLVSQADGKTAFCTVKDRSAGNAAKSLFIPALDKRPCFVDADDDGRFDASFDVFDKYGSALAPSGNLTKATPLKSAVAYEVTAREDFPSEFRMSYRLDGKRDPAKARIDVSFDNGSGKPELGFARAKRDGNSLKTMNVTFGFKSVEGDRATVAIATDENAHLVGTSDGTFAVLDTLPDFLGG